MKVTVEDGGPCRKVMSVDAPADEVRADYDAVRDAFVKAGRIRGFRKGKAPSSVVEKQYARDIIEDVKDRIVPRLYRAALEEQGIKPVAIVSVGDVAFSKTDGARFKVTLDVSPDFKLPKYKKIPVEVREVTVTDEQVSAAIERVRENMGRFEDVSGRPVQDGDLVMIDYSGRVGDKPVGELAPECSGIGEGTDFWALVGEREFLPGFRQGIGGAQVDEQRQIEVSFPADYHVKEVAGQNAVYDVRVKGMRERIPQAIDEDFLKRFDVGTEDALREKVRTELQEGEVERDNDRMREAISRYLLEKADFDLPASVVEQETGLMVRSMVQRSAMQGVTREQLEERRDEIVKAAAETSKDRVKLSYILSRIADEEGIEVSKEEVEARINSLAAQRNVSPEKFTAQLEKRGGVESLESDMRAEKALDHLLEQAKSKK